MRLRCACLLAVAAAPAWAASTTATPAAAAPASPLSRLAGATIVGALAAPPSPSFLARVRDGLVGGVILTGRWSSQAEMSATTARLQAAACVAGAPLLVGVDQEGGRVRRLPWAAPADSPAALGRLDDPDRVGRRRQTRPTACGSPASTSTSRRSPTSSRFRRAFSAAARSPATRRWRRRSRRRSCRDSSPPASRRRRSTSPDSERRRRTPTTRRSSSAPTRRRSTAGSRRSGARSPPARGSS